MDERLRFIGQLVDGEAMTDVCREFGISRKTGYKIFDRYKAHGLEASPTARGGRCATPTSCRGRSRAHVSLKRGKPHWGARKIRELWCGGSLVMCACRPEHHPCRARSPRPGQTHRQARQRATGTPLSAGAQLTICGAPTSRVSSSSATGATAIRSRHRPRLALCTVEALESTREDLAVTASSGCCRTRAAAAIRSDNGVPFASPNALFNLSKLSVWWLRLGIALERIKPGRPQQNGRHERMHLTLKKEATARRV